MIVSVLCLIQKSILNHFCKFILYEYICEYGPVVVSTSVNILFEKISKQQKSEKIGQKSAKNPQFCRYNNIYILL